MGVFGVFFDVLCLGVTLVDAYKLARILDT